MSSRSPDTLVLGLGNLLLGDEGAGVHAAWALAGRGVLPPTAKVLDVGTAVLDVLDDLEGSDRIVLVDAMSGGGPPGTIYRVPLEGCRSPSVLGSLHGFDLRRVLALTRREDLPEAVVLGIEPSFLGWSLELSPEVARALPHLVAAVEREVAGAGTTHGFKTAKGRTLEGSGPCEPAPASSAPSLKGPSEAGSRSGCCRAPVR